MTSGIVLRKIPTLMEFSPGTWKSLGNVYRELELSGRIYTWNLRILLRGSILCRTLPDFTLIIHVYTKFSPSFRFREHDLARCLHCSNSHTPARCWCWRAKSILLDRGPLTKTIHSLTQLQAAQAAYLNEFCSTHIKILQHHAYN